MYFIKNKEHVSLKTALGILFIIFISLLIAGCSDGGATEDNGAEPEEAGDPSEQAIRAVIEEEFNGPDEEYIELWEAMAEAQTSDEYTDDYEAFLESPERQAFESYMEETYASYFTENGYDNFINATPAFMYSRFEHEYELSTSDIEIVQSENGETLYDFTFQVEYTDANGESSQFDFEGDAIAPEEGKIGKIFYMDKDQALLDELNDNG